MAAAFAGSAWVGAAQAGVTDDDIVNDANNISVRNNINSRRRRGRHD